MPRLAFNGVSIPNDVINNSFKATPRNVTLMSTPNNLNGYVPKNNKLLTYPYCYVAFNPAGCTGKVFRYEDFANGTPSFSIISEINPNPNVCVIPQNYRGITGDDLSDICVITGYPNVSWSVDVYNVWLAQNSNIMNLNLSNNILGQENSLQQNEISQQQNTAGWWASLANSVVSGDPSSIASSTINSYFNKNSLSLSAERIQQNLDNQIYMQLAVKEAHQKLPNDVTFGSNNTTLIGYEKFDKNIFTRYTIKAQFAKRIDDYFSMFGYKINELKVPNINNRPNWNYVKTSDVNIIGDIPQEDLEIIKAMFDNGFTIWHNPATFLDYSQNNK